MKKHALFVIILILSFQGYSYSMEKEFVGKIGTSYAKEPEKFGLDLSFNQFFVLDPFFAAGIEADFFWLKWDRKLGTKEIGQTNASVKAQTNSYNIPVFFNAQVRLPNLAKIIYIEPSLIIGLGMDPMILDDSIPRYTDSNSVTHKAKSEINFYFGYAWQAVASFSLKPAPESNIYFTFDAGYRGIYPEKDGIQFNMSGFILRAGVKFKM